MNHEINDQTPDLSRREAITLLGIGTFSVGILAASAARHIIEIVNDKTPRRPSHVPKLNTEEVVANLEELKESWVRTEAYPEFIKTDLGRARVARAPLFLRLHYFDVFSAPKSETGRVKIGTIRVATPGAVAGERGKRAIARYKKLRTGRKSFLDVLVGSSLESFS